MLRPHRVMNSWGSEYGDDYMSTADMRIQIRAAYMLGKRSASASMLTDQVQSSHSSDVAGSSSSTAPSVPNQAGCQQRITACAARTPTLPSTIQQPTQPDLAAIDENINSICRGSYLTQQAVGEVEEHPSALMASLHTIAYIDSQATNFVVPDVAYLTTITDSSPTTRVETANGAVAPDAIGEAVISLFDDHGVWHTYHIRDVWVMSTCNKVLYSQSAMRLHGINHRLDDGFIILEDGSTKAISPQTYAIELVFGESMRSLSRPNDAHSLPAAEHDMPGAYVARSSVPQKLLWQRLGCPGSKIWSNVCDVVSDHGLPPNPHLRHEFDASGTS